MQLSQLALRRVALDLKDDAVDLADPRYWVPKFPLAAIGAGVGLGLLIGYLGYRRATREMRMPDEDSPRRYEIEIEPRSAERKPMWQTLAKSAGKLARQFIVPMLGKTYLSSAQSAINSFARA
jgi:hypothetical protein